MSLNLLGRLPHVPGQLKASLKLYDNFLASLVKNKRVSDVNQYMYVYDAYREFAFDKRIFSINWECPMSYGSQKTM